MPVGTFANFWPTWGSLVTTICVICVAAGGALVRVDDVGSIETRLNSTETQVSSINARVSAIESIGTRLTTVETTATNLSARVTLSEADAALQAELQREDHTTLTEVKTKVEQLEHGQQQMQEDLKELLRRVPQ